MGDFERFIEQNDLTAATLTAEQRKWLDEEGMAEHHAGGLYVLIVPMPGDRYTKCHDSWGDDGKVVVHTYDPEGDNGDPQVERYYDTGFEAVRTFRWLTEMPEDQVEDLLAAIEQAKEEILADMGKAVSSRSTTMPVTVSSFSELHDYVDANEYAGLCDDDQRAHWAHTGDLVNQMQNAVHHWLASGEARVEWTARFLYSHFADLAYAHVPWSEITEDFRHHWRNHARRLVTSEGDSQPDKVREYLEHRQARTERTIARKREELRSTSDAGSYHLMGVLHHLNTAEAERELLLDMVHEMAALHMLGD
jgi:hypothetical protein